MMVGTATVVRIDGRLDVRSVDELSRVCTQIDGPIRLDLVNLQVVDDAGLELIRSLAGEGATLLHTPPFVELRLQAQGRNGDGTE